MVSCDHEQSVAYQPNAKPAWIAITSTQQPPQIDAHTHVYIYMGVSQNYGYLFGGPHNEDYSIFWSILGFPILGKYHICVYIYISRYKPL